MKRARSEVEAALAQLDQKSLRRERRTIQGFAKAAARATLMLGGRAVIDFSSNDYLGLARHPESVAAMQECASRCGAGSAASHLVTGHGLEHERLEEQLALFTGRQRALLFSTGYMANLAVVTTLAQRGEGVLLDRLSHASLIDAGLLSGARFSRYRHGDALALGTALDEASPAVTVVATDGVFSMDGDLAPLDALARACGRHSAWLVVDDAHGLGILGKTGRGSLEHFGLDAEAVPVLVGTLGKAFGTFGAFVAGAAELIELLVQKARPYLYTTALPQPIAAATCKTLEIAQREPWRRERVLQLAARFRAACASAGLPMPVQPLPVQPLPVQPCVTPIQPLIVGSSLTALLLQDELSRAGFCVVAIRPPTVPEGTARLRITLSAAHSEEDVDALVEALSCACALHPPSSPLRHPNESAVF